MKAYVADQLPNTGISIEELESRISTSTQEIQAARDQLSTTVNSITARVDTLSDEMKLQHNKLSEEIGRQNVIILGMQQQFQESMADFSSKLQALYTNSSHNQHTTTTASTSKPSQWGVQDK